MTEALAFLTGASAGAMLTCAGFLAGAVRATRAQQAVRQAGGRS